MRQLIVSTGIALSLVAGAPGFQAMAQDAAAAETPADRQSSWYGQPYALNGQDVVSFFSDTGPVSGDDAFVAEIDNTQWKFTSAENRDAFLENPDQYMPEFGGYCPVALASGDVKIGSAEHFTVVDDKLYLNYDRESEDKFATQPEGYIAAAKLNF